MLQITVSNAENDKLIKVGGADAFRGAKKRVRAQCRAILDRLAGGADAIRETIGDAPYTALTTIDDVYPERPDR